MTDWNIHHIDAELLKSPPIDFVRLAHESRLHELDAAIQRFYNCGVTLDRMTIQETLNPHETVLCVDDIPRFAWRMVYPDHAPSP